MVNKRAIFINTASQVIVRFLTLAFTLVSIKLLSNYLGTQGLGEYNTITTYVNFFLVLADLGLFSVTIREIAKDPENEVKILSNVFIIRFISAIIACVVAIGIVNFTKYDANIKLGTLIAAGFLFFNLMASMFDIAFQYRLKMQFSALAELISKLISIGALILIIKSHGSFLWVASTIALSGILIFLFKWLFARKFIKLDLKYDKKISDWILKLAFPLGIVFIVNNLFFKLDTLMLFVIKGATTVGIYSVTYKVLEVTAFIGSYFASALKPTFAEQINKNKEYVGKVLSKSFVVMLYISLPITITCVAFSKEIIIFLSNSDFISGSKTLIFLAFTLPIIYFDTLLVEILIANDERKTLIKISVIVLLLNFLSNLYFIPKFSFMGAAITTLLSEIILCFLNIHYIKKILPFKLDFLIIGKVLLVALATLLITFIIKFSGIYFIFLIAISFAFYLVLSYLLKLIDYQTFKELINGKE